MTIYEPATLATDYLLVALGAVFAWRLARIAGPENRVMNWWVRCFICLAVSSFVGGSYHGFGPNFSPVVQGVWWWVVLLSIAMLGFAMGAALVNEVATGPGVRILMTGLVLKFVCVAIVTIWYPYFLVAIADYGSAMLAWLVAALVVRRPWRGWILLAVVLSGLAAWVQRESSLGLGWFNHNDLFHLVQAVALFAFYRAANCEDSAV